MTGAAITITPLPAQPAPGAAVAISVKATNANNVGIPNTSIQFSGIGSSVTLTTDSTGSATVNATAPATAGNYTLTAVGLGVTTTTTLPVVGGAGTIPAAVGPISGANLSINPTTIAPNAAGSTTNQAVLKAVFRDANNQAVQNVRVRFEVVPPTGSAGEQISTGTNIVYSDSSGIASSAYIAGTTTSATNGVNIRACYGYTDADIAGTLCPNSAPATLTVASQPISVTLGSNNQLQKTASNTMYVQTLVVVVNDSAGRAVSGANISYSVDITHYGKGYSYADSYYVNSLSTVLITPPNTSTTGINTTDMPTAPTAPTPPSTIPTGDGKRVWCPNEDTNRNGLIDTLPVNEDINGNGKLDPRSADVSILPVSGAAVTGTDGTLLLNVQWPMNVATWLAFTVKVSTAVGGTEGTDQKSYVTNFVKGDESNGSFLTPPYGYRNCVSPL